MKIDDAFYTLMSDDEHEKVFHVIAELVGAIDQLYKSMGLCCAHNFSKEWVCSMISASSPAPRYTLSYSYTELARCKKIEIKIPTFVKGKSKTLYMNKYIDLKEFVENPALIGQLCQNIKKFFFQETNASASKMITYMVPLYFRFYTHDSIWQTPSSYSLLNVFLNEDLLNV